MIKYTKSLKSKLFRLINQNSRAFTQKNDDNSIIIFLDNIWDLRSLPSKDSRYKDAYGDAYQHLVNNDDWNYEETFLDRFNLLEDDEIFTKFLETLVHPNFRSDKKDIEFYVSLINSELNDYILHLVDYIDDLPVYNIKINNIDKRADIYENTIPFYVNKTIVGEPNCFTLLPSDWDDYGSKTSFTLFYCSDENIVEEIGNIKITDGKTSDTVEVLSKKFLSLSSGFCSVGQSEDYYKILKKKYSDKLTSILYALKDASYFTEINDSFSSNYIFKNSLLRSDHVEKTSRNIKAILEGIEVNNKYKFSYKFTPNYSNTPIQIDLIYDSNLVSSDRIFAVIGKNGTGKTQLITSLPIDLSINKSEKFTPHRPLFSKIIAVSYSIFDNYKTPKSNSSFNYVYCGLLNSEFNLRTDSEKNTQLLKAYSDKIKIHDRTDLWREILTNFIDEKLINDLFTRHGLRATSTTDYYQLNESIFIEKLKTLSSGQSILLEIITKIVANIRYDSLILFDEPETHLHPNAISQLISTIYDLAEKFDSYCLITTHSPIIIQNIFAKNVYVMEKDENQPILRKIGIECFGENLSVLTEDIFGNREMEKQYKVILDRMIDRYADYDTILNKIELNNIPLSLNAKLYLKSKTF